MSNKKTDLISLRITVIYMIVGSLWVLLSDKLLNLLVQDKEMITFISLVKGWFYVSITGVLIYFLINKSLKQLNFAQAELNQTCNAFFIANEKLQETNLELEEKQAELEEQYQQILLNEKKLLDTQELYRLISEGTNDSIWLEGD